MSSAIINKVLILNRYMWMVLDYKFSVVKRTDQYFKYVLKLHKSLHGKKV